ncbi:MAG: MlaE family ABC transporter permease [Endomicrobiales bacterium]
MKNIARKITRSLGGTLLATATGLGQALSMMIQTFSWISRGVIDTQNTVFQMVEVGWRSFPVIGLTSLFTGMVLALQSGSSSKNIFNEPVYVGTIVGFSLVRELGPVLTSIVVAGRVGAAITAELGSMKVTEQMDALYTLGTNPVRYLAVPRFLACLFMLPLLSILANIIGILGGMFITVVKWGVPSTVYWDDIFNYMDLYSFFHGLIKSFIFGGIIVTTAVHKGFTTEGGAEGVGKATTSAVMISMVLILISDYFLTTILVALGIS